MASDSPQPASPTPATTATTTLTAQCHCKSVHFTVTVPTSTLPLPTHLCHCFICRRVHGSLCCFHAPLPASTQPHFIPPSSPTNSVTRYRHTQHPAADRIFCATCGSHIGDEDTDPDPSSGTKEWRVATSLFSFPLFPASTHNSGAHDNAPAHDGMESAFQIRSHFFTASELGPGLHTWLPRLGARLLPSRTPAEGDPIFPIPRPAVPEPEFDALGRERLRAECHCGGVSFTLPRPTDVVDDGGDDAGSLVKRVASPVDAGKWVASLDACRDCRLVTGTHVVAWAAVPLRVLQPAVPGDFRGFGTLRPYASSEGVLRGFCGVCGATVLCSREDEGEGGRRIVRVSVGILRAPEGPAAENWLTWRTGRVLGHESGMEFDPVFTESLAKGFREWGEKTYGEALTFDGIP